MGITRRHISAPWEKEVGAGRRESPVPEVCEQGLAKETTDRNSALIQGPEGPQKHLGSTPSFASGYDGGGPERVLVCQRPNGPLAGFRGCRRSWGRGEADHLTCLSAPVPFLLQRLKYLLTPREPNRWAVEREGATPYSSRLAVNGALMKPTHIIVETMM